MFVSSPRPFQIMRPEAMTDAKLSTCSRTWICSIICDQFVVIPHEKKAAVHVASLGVASTLALRQTSGKKRERESDWGQTFGWGREE